MRPTVSTPSRLPSRPAPRPARLASRARLAYRPSYRGSHRPPDLATERLVLRDLQPGDAAAVAAGAGDRRVAAYLIDVPSPYPIALARRWVAHRIDWWTESRGVTFAVTL